MKAIKFIFPIVLFFIMFSINDSYSQKENPFHAVIIKNDTMRAYENEIETMDKLANCMLLCVECNDECNKECPEFCDPNNVDQPDKSEPDHAHIVPTDTGLELPDRIRFANIFSVMENAIVLQNKIDNSILTMNSKYKKYLIYYSERLNNINRKLDLTYKKLLVNYIYKINLFQEQKPINK